jgi:CheY-like chemotaxis protein
MTGRKLLLADDSVTIRKVIDLTFSDEGLDVTTVGDGDQALQKLEESTPDIVLADVLMPGLDGYGLCEFIKQSEKFRRIPVMLLVGSFEPFDEAEARRVGADDVLTKPFQSIKQLVSRVGSLLGGKTDDPRAAGGFSTLGLAQTVRPSHVGAPETRIAPETSIEAAPPIHEPEECDIEMQTADTLKLRPVEGISAGPAASLHNRFEAQPVNILTAEETTPIAKSDVLLDLDDFQTCAAPSEIDDSILDLEYIESVELAEPVAGADFRASLAPEAATPTHSVTEYGHVSEPQAPPGGAERESVVGRTAVEERAEEASAAAPELSPRLASTELSAEAVDAIAQRVVEKLSDKVVREIAWEVVPELAELLIKQRLEEKQRRQ